MLDHRMRFKQLPFVRRTSVISASSDLLTLGIVSSIHGQLVTLLPSVPLSPAPCRPLALWLVVAHFDRLLILWRYKGMSPRPYSHPSICIQVVPRFKGREAHFCLMMLCACGLSPVGGDGKGWGEGAEKGILIKTNL